MPLLLFDQLEGPISKLYPKAGTSWRHFAHFDPPDSPPSTGTFHSVDVGAGGGALGEYHFQGQK